MLLLEPQYLLKLTNKIVNKNVKKKIIWREEDMYNNKRLIGELLGATIPVVWIIWALVGAGNVVGLAVAISLTILLGVSSGGVIALSKKTSNYKEVIGWVLGAAIAVAWINFALIYGDTVSLAAAIILTILLGTLSGGFIALSNKPKTI